MGTLGKVLLFVNLAAAAGVLYLAGQDWAARQEVAATALRYHVAVKGLPVEAEPASGDRVPFPLETAGGHTVGTVRKSFLAGLFQGADGGPQLGGEPVGNQVEEVKRAQTKADAALGGLDDAARLALLAGRVDPRTQAYTPGWLGQMAETYEEREYVRGLAAGGAAALGPARAMLDRRFEAVLKKPDPQAATAEAARVKELADALRQADERARQAYARLQPLAAADPGRAAAAREYDAAREAVDKAQADVRAAAGEAGGAAARDDGDRRRRIAHLLMHLDPAAGWQKRVGLVVGLRTYLRAVAAQVDKTRDMAGSVRQQVALDQAAFAEQYDLLQTLARDRARLLARQAGVRADLEAQRSKDAEAAALRRAQLLKRQQDLAALQGQVAEGLGRQAEVEKALADLQRRVREGLDQSADLERKLQQAEERGGN